MKPASFVGRILAPYVDLSRPETDGPVHAWRPWISWQKTLGHCQREGNLQRILPPGFRASLDEQLEGGLRVAVEDPEETPAEDRSEAWATLCELVRAQEQLAPERRAAVLGTLLSLGFFGPLARASVPDAENIAASDWQASCALAIQAAKTILAVTGVGSHDLSPLEQIARAARPSSVPRFSAEVELVVQYGRHRRDLAATQHWRSQAWKTLQAIVAERGAESFTAHLLTSRFYRSASYVPFIAGDRGAVVREMDLCEEHAVRAAPTDAHEALLARENKIPMLQSRAKEARWLGDLGLAHHRLLRARDLDPADSLRWVELGEVELDLGRPAAALESYLTAARLAPPGGALSWFMAAEAARACGQLASACAYYQHALAIDGSAVAAARRLSELGPQVPGFAPLELIASRLIDRAIATPA